VPPQAPHPGSIAEHSAIAVTDSVVCSNETLTGAYSVPILPYKTNVGRGFCENSVRERLGAAENAVEIFHEAASR
jgi:hypothetical protein